MQPATSLEYNVRWRLVVPITALLFLSSLDRVNISFAASGMNQALGLSPSEYGFGAGVLFVGYLAGQYPSVLLLQRIGMRRWAGSCAVLWALACAGVTLVHSPLQFYILRILIGLAEGGLAPGVVLYLSQFTTEGARAKTFGVPMIAIPLSVVVGSPLSGWLMSTVTPGGLAPWRWLLIAEALPALLLGMIAFAYFPDRPEQAKWVPRESLEYLRAHAAAELRGAQPNDWSALRRPWVWAAAIVWFCLLSGSYGILFWLPQIVKSLTGLSPATVGWITALPWLGAAAGMYFNAAHSDRVKERFWHVALPALIAAAAVWAAGHTHTGATSLAALLILGIGLGASQGAFWSIPTLFLNRSTLAVAAVMINLLGSAGGLVMPHLIGYGIEHWGGAGIAAVMIAAILAGAGLLTLLLMRAARPPPTALAAL